MASFKDVCESVATGAYLDIHSRCDGPVGR